MKNLYDAPSTERRARIFKEDQPLHPDDQHSVFTGSTIEDTLKLIRLEFDAILGLNRLHAANPIRLFFRFKSKMTISKTGVVKIQVLTGFPCISSCCLLRGVESKDQD